MTDAKMFDGYADAYDQWFMTNSNVFASELTLLHRALHDIEKETILSIGCGSGLFESALHLLLCNNKMVDSTSDFPVFPAFQPFL